MNWTKSSNKVWNEIYVSDDGRWQIEPFATSEGTAPDGWGVIDMRREGDGYAQRYDTLDKAKAAVEGK